MAYATYTDVQARITRELTEDEQAICTTLLDDAGVIIDTFNADATEAKKKIVSCNMVIRALTDSDGVPMGATQGTMSAMGYSQSWTIGTGGSVGELYLSKIDKRILGVGNRIGSYSPVQELEVTDD